MFSFIVFLWRFWCILLAFVWITWEKILLIVGVWNKEIEIGWENDGLSLLPMFNTFTTKK